MLMDDNGPEAEHIIQKIMMIFNDPEWLYVSGILRCFAPD